VVSMKKPQISVEPEVHKGLKQYCALKGKKISHVVNQVLGDFLKTKHEEIPSEGEMVVEEKKRPQTIVGILKGEG